MSTPREVAVLIERYLDDELDEDGRSSLLHHLQQDADLRTELIAQMAMAGLLVDAHRGDDFADRTILRCRQELAEPSRSNVPSRRMSSRRNRIPRGRITLAPRWWGPIAACLIIGVLALLMPWGASSAIATVAAVHGDGHTVERGGRRLPVVVGMALHDQETLQTGVGQVIIRYRDETRIRLQSDSSLRLFAGDGKRLVLDTGGVTADVTKQPAGNPLRIGTPQADLVVVGTTFRLLATAVRSHLTVEEGIVRMQRIGGTDGLDVVPGRAAIADAGGVAWEPPAPPEALVVHTGAGADALVVARLKERGLTVVERNEATLTAGDAIGKALVVITEQVTVEKLDGRLQATTAPLLVWECGLYDQIGFARNGGFATRGQALTILRPDHPLAAGLTGTVTVTRSTRTLSSVAVVDVPTQAVVATIPGAGGRPAMTAGIFAYERGDRMPNGRPAPARRVGFFLAGDMERELTPAGWDLFNAAVSWCLQKPTATPSP